MPANVDPTATLRPGSPTLVCSASAQPPWAVVFEDDGETGWFYAIRGLHGRTLRRVFPEKRGAYWQEMARVLELRPEEVARGPVEAFEDQPIIDALQVYEVDRVADRSTPSRVEIGWCDRGTAAILLINGYPHAVVDFEHGPRRLPEWLPGHGHRVRLQPRVGRRDAPALHLSGPPGECPRT